MDDHDWGLTQELFAKLWPPQAAKISDERWQSFRRCCGGAKFAQAQVALRTLSDTSQYPPKPADLRKLLQGGRGESPDAEHPSPSWPDLIRQQMNGCTGHILPEHAAMSDNAVQAWYHGGMVRMAHRTYCNTPGCTHCEEHPEVRRHIALRDTFQAAEERI